jgi:LacI family transcriptional regulator
MPHDSPPPTIEELARLAGISPESASRVVAFSPLAGKDARARVAQALAGLGQMPPPLPRRSVPARAPLLAVLHDGAQPALLAEALVALEPAIAGHGLALLVHRIDASSRNLSRGFVEFLEARRPAAALILPPLSAIDDLAGLCWEYGCAHVRLGASVLDHPQALVASTDRRGMAEVVSQLVALGHRRIAALVGPDGDAIAQERELGYLDAMAEHGLDRGPALVAQGDWSFASGEAAARLLLQVSPCPTAIAAANDEMAAGALNAARALGIAVPEALSITGFGDTPLAAQLWPPLSGVRVPLADMLRTAAAKLLDPEGAAGLPWSFATCLVPRGTTAPPPAAQPALRVQSG